MPLKYNTLYSTLPIQSLVIVSIKQPLLEAVEILTDKTASKIAKLKAVAKVWKAIQAVSQLPEPTLENTWHPNTHNLVTLRDHLLGHANLNSQRRGFIRNFFNLAIIIYDFDPPWRWIMDSVKDKALKMNWKEQGWGDDWSDGYDWWKGESKDA